MGEGWTRFYAGEGSRAFGVWVWTRVRHCGIETLRQGRPVAEKMQGKGALLTCERVCDALFPVTQGGTCAVLPRLAPENC